MTQKSMMMAVELAVKDLRKDGVSWDELKKFFAQPISIELGDKVAGGYKLFLNIGGKQRQVAAATDTTSLTTKRPNAMLAAVIALGLVDTFKELA